MIEIQNITKSFGENEVLKNISFTFERGKTNLIIGESGSGKTTLLRILIGLHQTDKGNILYDGRDFTKFQIKEKRKLRQEIGVLFQRGALYDFMNVEENIMFPLTMFTEKSEEDIYTAPFNEGCMLIMGNEETGVHKSLLQLADHKAKIPMMGTINSLNVSVATGILF